VLLVFDLTVVDRETFPLELVVDGVKPLEKAKRVAPNARALVSLPGQAALQCQSADELGKKFAPALRTPAAAPGSS
jgi:hypothetical protein